MARTVRRADARPGRGGQCHATTRRRPGPPLGAARRPARGGAATPPPRQVRGQIRRPYRDAIRHRLRALRAFGQLPASERAKRQPPKTSTFMRAKLDSVVRVLRLGRGGLDAGKEAMQGTRQEVAADWRATADALRRQGEGDLAAQVDRFVARMPAVQTDAQRMADRWREQGRSRALERSDTKPPAPQVR